MGTAVGGTLDAWREAVQVVGNDVIRTLRQGGWDYDLVDDDALAVLPADESRPVVVAGATDLPEPTQAWLDRHVGGRRHRGHRAVRRSRSPVRAPPRSADLAAVLASCCRARRAPRPGERGHRDRCTAVRPTPTSIWWSTPVRSRQSFTGRRARSAGRTRSGTPARGRWFAPASADRRLGSAAASLPGHGDRAERPEPAAGGRIADDLGYAASGRLQDGWQVQFADRDSGARARRPAPRVGRRSRAAGLLGLGDLPVHRRPA